MAEPVVRVRLLEPLCAARVGLVQAPGGWGKSTLVAQLAARLRPSGAVAVVAVAPTVVGFRADLAAVLKD